MFPKKKASSRNDVRWEITLEPAATRKVLERCKSHNVSPSNAIFAACNFAWIRTQRAIRARAGRLHDRESEKVPMLMYTAINLRPQIAALAKKGVLPNADPFYPALGYLNIILPSFIPTSSASSKSLAELEEAIFWYRAQNVKSQNSRYVRHPMLGSRVIGSYEERALRALRFAKEDDEAQPRLRYVAWDQGRPIPETLPPTRAPSSLSVSVTESAPLPPQKAVMQELTSSRLGNSPLMPKPPSAALMGFSLIGNIDAVYQKSKHYGPLLVERVRVSNRRAKGGMLATSRMLNGKMMIGLILDEGGFEGDVVKEFWDECIRCIKEYMVGEKVGTKARM